MTVSDTRAVRASDHRKTRVRLPFRKWHDRLNRIDSWRVPGLPLSPARPRGGGGALPSPATALSSSPMAQLALHHVSLIVTDLPRSLAFYQNLFGLTIMERPPFKSAGAWLACGALQVHLILTPFERASRGAMTGLQPSAFTVLTMWWPLRALRKMSA
jgi:hypothetical protein